MFPESVLEIEKETTGEGKSAKVVYEIIFKKGNDKVEAQLDPSGKCLAEEKVKEKKKEEDKEKQDRRAAGWFLTPFGGDVLSARVQGARPGARVRFACPAVWR